jgi:DNA polymerase III alpha subunit (gram-positive type)
MNYTQPRLTDVSFVALDTETTGLFPIMHRLVEIGAGRFRLDGRELATFQQLIDPQMPIPEDVQHGHGITDRMVRGKPTIEHALPQFIDFLDAPSTILLDHNARFDLAFLATALTRWRIACPPHWLFDTLDLTRRLFPLRSSQSLENVVPPGSFKPGYSKP